VLQHRDERGETAYNIDVLLAQNAIFQTSTRQIGNSLCLAAHASPSRVKMTIDVREVTR
jgi:hypothetical protein